MKCEKCGKTIKNYKSKTLKIAEFNLEVTEIQDWDKPYNEITVPKGWRLSEIWEIGRIIDSKYYEEFIGKNKEKWSRIWCAQTAYAKENDKSSCAFLGRCRDWGSGNGHLADSNSGGRVVFVRDLNDKKR